MSTIDFYHQETLKQLMDKDWTVDNRAVWKDGSPIQTKRMFGVVNKYDLSKEFPILTLRPVPFELCFREIDWIYRKRSNNVNDFKGNIWNSWANETGSIGRAYGYQVAKPIMGYDNQMDFILEEIKNNPSSRRMIIEMWNVDDLDKMNLPPCAHHLQFVVDEGKVNLILKQRSQDFLVANGFNVCEYAILLHMVARHTGYGVGTLLHIIGDCHIYNKHIKQAEEMLARTPLKAPRLLINEDVANFYDFKSSDFCLEDYETHKQLKFEVAI